MKSKYSEELVETILEALRETGSDSESCKIAGISRETLYQYIKKFPDFADRAKEARSFYKQHCPATLKRAALEAFERLITGQAEAISITTEEWVNSDGSTSFKTTKRVQNVVPPRYAIERVLGLPTPPTAAEFAEKMLDWGYSPSQLVEALKEKWTNRAERN